MDMFTILIVHSILCTHPALPDIVTHADLFTQTLETETASPQMPS